MLWKRINVLPSYLPSIILAIPYKATKRLTVLHLFRHPLRDPHFTAGSAPLLGLLKPTLMRKTGGVEGKEVNEGADAGQRKHNDGAWEVAHVRKTPTQTSSLFRAQQHVPGPRHNHAA